MPRTTYTDVGQHYLVDPGLQLRGNAVLLDWDNITAKTVPAGTVLCRLASGKYCPRAERPGAETAARILLATAHQDDASDAVGHGVLIGGPVYENLLPDKDDAAWADFKTELAAAGCTFVYETYGDSRGS